MDAIIKNTNLLAALSEEGSIVGTNIEVRVFAGNVYGVFFFVVSLNYRLSSTENVASNYLLRSSY